MDGVIAPRTLVAQTEAMPVPARQMLRLAIHGWAVAANVREVGVPAMPHRTEFLPVFIRLLHRHDWRNEVDEMAMTGLRCDGSDPALADTVHGLMQHPGLLHSMVDELAVLASR